ncbi:MAG TPA: histidine kinase dimerization/phosphoacceptor domain -containing protein [Methanocella sp.]|nr:histidine kinase dimerization/phosphoacceptor domain -containing protein [Methanocella sp.]
MSPDAGRPLEEIPSHMEDYRELLRRIAGLEQFRAIMDRSGDAIIIVDLGDGQVRDVSGTTVSRLGHSRRALMDMTIDDLVDRETRNAICSLSTESARRSGIAATLYGKDGLRVAVTLSASAARLDGRPIAVLIARETAGAAAPMAAAPTAGTPEAAEGRPSEEKLLAALHEKEVMLKEIHHRVKNNLQVISSLLSIQARYLNDPRDVKLFQESQDRIRTMALVHEKLYQSSDLETIDFGPYIERLTTNLFRSYRSGGGVINLRIDVKDVRIGEDRAGPCGLIVNELVTNALKYAFPDGRDGTVTVVMRQAGDDYVLEVADDGVGIRAGAPEPAAGSAAPRDAGETSEEAELRRTVEQVKSDFAITAGNVLDGIGMSHLAKKEEAAKPDRFDIARAETLGLQLVRTLTEQLEGTIQVDASHGTKYTITFKK